MDENGSGASLDPTKMSLVSLYFAPCSSESELLGVDLSGTGRKTNLDNNKKKN